LQLQVAVESLRRQHLRQLIIFDCSIFQNFNFFAVLSTAKTR
jgi:hypothetical protein